MHSEFARLTRHGGVSDPDVWRALSDGYRYKEMADYSTDPDADISAGATGQIIADAARFAARVTELLTAPSPDAG